MKGAGSTKRFLAAPAGRWVAGRAFVVWNWSPSLGGSVIWGRPTEDDIDKVFQLSDAYHRVVGPCDVVTDVSRIVEVHPSAYARLMRNIRDRGPMWAKAVRRHAMVRSEGLLGALAEGFYPLVGAPYPWRAFATADEAFRWVDVPDALDAHRAVASIVDELMGTSPVLRQLREFVRSHIARPSVRSAASAIGVSERTLHRMLHDADTRFRDQVAQVRVAEAQKLLAETDLKIEAIAQRVGCCSHAHLTTLFRRHTGRTPAQYRVAVERP